MSRRDKDWKKFGSPYDPSHGGKQKLNAEQEAKRSSPERQDRYQLRGCGDPDCAACNVEVATARMRSGSSRSPFRSGNTLVFDDFIEYRSIGSMMSDIIG